MAGPNIERLNSFPSENRLQQEEKEIPHMSYKKFLQRNTAELGTVITNVKPRELFTYQDWVDDEKTASVIGRSTDGDPNLFEITGYLHHHTKFDKNVLVVGNGHHRALLAISSEQKVNIHIEKEPTEREENPFRITNLLKKYGDIFGGF